MTIRRALFWVLLAVLALAAGWARTNRFRSVFPPSGEVELVPTDSHLYVRFALLQRHALPHLTSFDPYLNFPHGADVYAPLPHAWLIAAFIGLGGEGRPELGAAWVGPVVGLIEWLLIVLLARAAVGRRTALRLGAVLALVPAIVEVQELGTADHHVHEPMLIAAAALALIPALGERTGRWPRGAGLILGVGRFLSPTGFLSIPLAALAVVFVGWRSRRDPEAGHLGRAARMMALWAAGPLLLGAVIFGHPLSLEYEQFSAFHPLLAASLLLGASGLVGLLRRERGAWRWVAAGTLLALPLVAQLVRAAGHLGRADPLLAIVWESEPLWSDPKWALELLGPLPVVFVAAVVGLVLRLRREVDVAAGVALVFSVLLAIPAAAQARFAPSFGAAAAVACVIGLGALIPPPGSSWRGPVRLLILVAFLPLGLALLPRPYEPPPRDILLARPTLRWMRTGLPPASADPYSTTEKPSYAVVAIHLLGHVLPLWAERPTLATMASGDPAFIESNLRAANILAAEDDETAYATAAASGVRYVLATPSDRLLGHGAPTAKAELLHLLDYAGLESPERPATGHFRLVRDSPEQRTRAEGGSFARLFEVVAGARLEGRATPNAEVWAEQTVRTNLGAELKYRVRASAGPDGAFTLRVAYPGTYRLGGALQGATTVTEEQIQEGVRKAFQK